MTFNNVHDPDMDTTKPLVKIFTPQDIGVGVFGAEPSRVCKVCSKIPGVSIVRSSESKIITHVKEVYVRSLVMFPGGGDSLQCEQTWNCGAQVT